MSVDLLSGNLLLLIPISYLSYFSDLQQKAKERYTHKLDMLGLAMSDPTLPFHDAPQHQTIDGQLAAVTVTVVWRPSEFVILRVDLDNDFITKAFQEATTFLTAGILPELVRKWCTKAPVYSHVPAITEDIRVSDS